MSMKAKYSRLHRQMLREKGLCAWCGKNPSEHYLCEECGKRNRENRRKYYTAEEAKIIRKRSTFKCRTERRAEIFKLLGDKCSNPDCLVPGRCRDLRCLQIDHVNGSGSKERKRFNGHGPSFYKYVIKQIKAGSKKYQLLCANCNWIKRLRELTH